MENINKLCEFCNKNIDLAEHDRQVRAEVIDELMHEINRHSEYARPVGWSRKTEIICTSVVREIMEKIKNGK